MHVSNHVRPLHKRQNGEPPPLPTAPGLGGGATASNDLGSAATSLIVNQNSAELPAIATAAPALVSGSNIIITNTPTSSPTPSVAPVTSAPTQSSSSNVIPLGTTIGACVGAFIGFLFLVFAGVWYYRRSGRKGRKSGFKGPSSPLSDSRNTRGNTERRRSRLEPWNKLREKELDIWDGMAASPSTRTVITFPEPTVSPATRGSVDKLGAMFKSSPSLHSTQKSISSDEHGQLEFGDALAGSAQFAKYHPHLAEELAKTVTPMRANVARQDAGPPISWDGETVHDDETFLSLHSGRIDSSHLSSASEAMSPTIVRPKVPPSAATPDFHRWESAEVLHYNEDQNQTRNPFSDIDLETRKNVNNPFFNAQGLLTKRRASNPFSDSVKRPFTHATQDSSASMSSTDRAMQSLIAALDVSPEEVEERLRIASMHPSVKSTGSALEDDASVAEFPLPPTQVPRY